MSENHQTLPLSSDAPIGRSDQDRFGRDRLARRIALEAVTAAPNDGFVIALCGAWGTGKTSVVNLVKEDLDHGDRAIVVSFNPWLFSGADDLVGTFLGQLAATLRKGGGSTRTIANKVARYAGALSGAAAFAPIVGGTAASVLRAAQQAAAVAGQVPPLQEQREELVIELKKLDRRIVVFIDDVDRLTDNEMREVVRLVKLVGDLPRVTYILVFDRLRVEEALAGTPGPLSPGEGSSAARDRGRAYLEKIVQSRHDVPPLRPPTLMRFLFAALDEALAPYLAELRLHEHDWGNMVGLSLRYMIRTPRDAKRLSNAAAGAAEMLSDEVALVDLLGLEALRVFEPDVHADLVDVADILVDDRLTLGNEERHRKEDDERIGALLAKAKQRAPTRQMLTQLFPKAHRALGDSRSFKEERTERRELRVSQPSIFRAYLHAVLDDDTLAAAEVARIAAMTGDPAAFRLAVEPLSANLLADLVDRLLDFKDLFDPATAGDIALILLTAESRLPPDESPLATGTAPASWTLKSLVGHLLLSEQDPQRRAALAEQLVERAPSLSERLRALSWFGTFPDRDRRDPDAEMIDEKTTRRLTDDMRQRTMDAQTSELASEPFLLDLLAAVVQRDEKTGVLLVAQKAKDDELLLAILRAAFAQMTSQTLGEAAVRRQPRLNWEALSKLLGEDELRRRVGHLDANVDRSDLNDDTAAALDLAAAIVRGEVNPRNQSL